MVGLAVAVAMVLGVVGEVGTAVGDPG